MQFFDVLNILFRVGYNREYEESKKNSPLLTRNERAKIRARNERITKAREPLNKLENVITEFKHSTVSFNEFKSIQTDLPSLIVVTECLSYLKSTLNQKNPELADELANHEKNLFALIDLESEDIFDLRHEGNTLLHLLALHGIPIKRLVRKLHVDTEKSDEFISAFINAQNQDGLTALHVAAQKNEGATLHKLLSHYEADPNILDKEGKAPLHYAIELYQDPSIIEKLRAPTDPDNPDIWSKGLENPKKYQKINRALLREVPLHELNIKYCLLAQPIFDLHHLPVERLLQKAKERIDDTAMYTLMAVPTLLQQIIAEPTYFEEFKTLLPQLKDTQLVCIILQNDQFTDFLFKENNLKTLIDLSIAHPEFALDILQKHRNRIAQHPERSLFFAKLKEHYKTFEALEKTVSHSLAERDIRHWKEDKNQDKFSSTPLHIAARYGSLEIISDISQRKPTDFENWCNTRDQDNKTPLEIALRAQTLDISIIKILYDHTTDPEILSTYLPEYLRDSVLENTTEAFKDCIEAYPFQLTNPLIHSRSFQAYQILEKIIHQDYEIEEKLSSLLKAFSKNPMTLLVAIFAPIFKKYIEAILSDPESSYTYSLFSNIYQNSREIGYINASKLAMPLVKQGFTLQKTLDNQNTFYSRACRTHNLFQFPEIALYLLEEHLDICKANLESIAGHYTIPYYLDLFEITGVHIHQESQADKTSPIISQHVRHRVCEEHDKAYVFNISRQITDDNLKHLDSPDILGNTLLHRIMKLKGVTSNALPLCKSSGMADEFEESNMENTSKTLSKLIQFSIKEFAKRSQNQYQNKDGDTFLHLAVMRDEKIISLIAKHIQQLEGGSNLFKTLCSLKNNQGKLPLEVALETGNIAGVELLLHDTEEAMILQNAFSTKNNDLSTLHTKIQSDFLSIKKEYRLLNDAYRSIFKECLKCFSRSPSAEKTSQTIQTTLQENKLGVYVFVDYPLLFEYLLKSKKPENVINIFKNSENSFVQKALLAALNNQKFCTALNTHITEALAVEFGISTSDAMGKAMEPEQLLQDIYRILNGPLQQINPTWSFEVLSSEVSDRELDSDASESLRLR